MNKKKNKIKSITYKNKKRHDSRKSKRDKK